MKTKSDSPGNRFIRRARTVARRSDKAVKVPARRVATPPPAELRLTPDTPLLRRLKKEAARIKGEIVRQEVLTQDHPSSGNHMADDASEVFEQTKDMALKHNLETMLEQVEKAMHRAAAGKYGLCDKCGEPIGAERLQALPYATTCVHCAKSTARLV